MSDLENALVTIIETFHKYSGNDGDKLKLKKADLKNLINNELSNFIGDLKDPETLDKLMESLDTDGDAECDFQEYVAFISMVTTACHGFFVQKDE
ncbi:protein S100-B [Leucoraja erinacea]|uniref:protein S100-B n=1 Tax=Leucoraja erinaceus TaxID=7782 RepID=UPI0024558854|nr:protein S100-B [Leucoraja erinacea]XP_055494496.1 protein S100-B [Leucoraja erinacea]